MDELTLKGITQYYAFVQVYVAFLQNKKLFLKLFFYRKSKRFTAWIHFFPSSKSISPSSFATRHSVLSFWQRRSPSLVLVAFTSMQRWLKVIGTEYSMTSAMVCYCINKVPQDEPQFYITQVCVVTWFPLISSPEELTSKLWMSLSTLTFPKWQRLIYTELGDQEDSAILASP